MFKEAKAELEISAGDFCGDELTSWGLFVCLLRSPRPPVESMDNHIYLRSPRSQDKEELVEDPDYFRVGIYRFVFCCLVSRQAPLAVFSGCKTEARRAMFGHISSPALGWSEHAGRRVRLSNNGVSGVFLAGWEGLQVSATTVCLCEKILFF